MNYFIVFLIALFLPANALAAVSAPAGGTGISSSSGLSVGDCLKVGSITSPTIWSWTNGSCGSGGGAFPFDVTSYGVSTSTTLGLLNGFLSTASSTIGSGTQTGGLTISGGATTTGSMLVTGGITAPGVNSFGTAGTATTTILGDLRVGSISGNDNMLRVQAARTYSNSVSVGGAFNLTNTSNDGAGMVLFTNHTGSATGRLFSVDCGSALFDQNCVNIQSAGTQSAVNISGGSPGLGIVKIAGLSGAPSSNSSATLSVDSSANSFQGQGIFAKCNSATTTPCFVLRDASSNLMFSVDGNKLTTMVNASTSLFANSGSTWLTSLATPAGSIIAVDPDGKIIATTTSAGGVTSVTGTYPVQSTGGGTPSISLAFGTTTNNTWAGTQTFNNVTVNGTCTGCGGGSSVWPWTVATTFGTSTNATTTGEWFQQGLYASSTSQIAFASTTALSANALYSSAGNGLIFGSDQMYDDGSQLILNRGGDAFKITPSYMRSTFLGSASAAVYSSTGLNNSGGMYFPTPDSVGFTLGGAKRFEIGIGSTTAFGNLRLNATSSALLATDNVGNIIATTSIGTNFLTGTLATINGTAITAGGSPTITAASSTLLTNNNTWTGQNMFSGGFSAGLASSTSQAASVTIDWNQGSTFQFLLTQNTTINFNATSSNPLNGGHYIIDLCQDGVGSRTVNFVNLGQLEWDNGTTTVQAAANTNTHIGMYYKANVGRYIIVASSTPTDTRACK